MSRASMWVRGVLLLTVLMAGLTEADWLQTFSQETCGEDISCRNKTSDCYHLMHVGAVHQNLVKVLGLCYSEHGSSTLRPEQITVEGMVEVMSGAHGHQLLDCILAKMGLLINGGVNQAAMRQSMAETIISENEGQQKAFLDALSNCPGPSRTQLITFGTCAMQSCASALQDSQTDSSSTSSMHYKSAYLYTVVFTCIHYITIYRNLYN